MADKNDKAKQDRETDGHSLSSLVYEPIFELNENSCIDLGSKIIGQDVQLILNYKVIEKTKNYCILKILSSSLRPSKRTF